MKRVLVPLFASLSLAAASPALAQQPMPRPQPMPRAGAMAPRMAMPPGGTPAQRLLALRTQLALTDDQVARLQQLATTQHQALVPPLPAMLRARADLIDAMEKDNLDAAHAAMERMARLRTDAAFARLKAGSDARNVLTAEQKARLQQVQVARRGQMGARGARGMGSMRGMRNGMGMHRGLGMGTGMGMGSGMGMGPGMGPGMSMGRGMSPAQPPRQTPRTAPDSR